MEKATFGAGCFWGVESTFMELDGVTNTMVGYMGGKTKHPTYEEVCSDNTGHAEVVYVEFDPTKITYENLLMVFWNNHNPTTPNRQGPDIGSQYRSAVFYYNEQQKNVALATKAKLDKSGKFKKPMVTEITPAGEFWKGEEYHQKYYQKRGIKKQCNVSYE